MITTPAPLFLVKAKPRNKVESGMFKDGKVKGHVFVTRTGKVVMEGDVHDPVQIVFNAPVAARGVED